MAAELEAVFAARTRAEWAAFADAHPCCLEPVLELDEALDRAPGGRRGDRAARRRGRAAARRAVPPLAHAGRRHAAGPGPGEHTRAVLAELGYAPEEIAALEAAGAAA